MGDLGIEAEMRLVRDLVALELGCRDLDAWSEIAITMSLVRGPEFVSELVGPPVVELTPGRSALFRFRGVAYSYDSKRGVGETRVEHDRVTITIYDGDGTVLESRMIPTGRPELN